MKRRNFVQGLALGAGVGTLGAMGAYCLLYTSDAADE